MNTTGVFLCLLISSQVAHTATDTADFQPFEIREQNLFNLIHGQALPSNAQLLNKNQQRWSSSLIISNTLNIESHDSSNGNESITLDYESYRLNFSYQYGLYKHWNLKLDIPLIHQTGGVLDASIDNWHKFFGLPRAKRPFIEDNRYKVQYIDQSQVLLDLNEESTTLGDIQLSAARSLIENSSTSMSIWASLKLPTGDKSKLSGSGAADLSAWLAVNQSLAKHWLINLNAGAVFLGEDNYQGIPLSEQVLYGHIMLGWLLSDSINIKAQLQGHSSYYEHSPFKILGPAYFLTFGATVKISPCQQLDIAISEDIKLDASPDSSFLISWRSYTSAC